jgi:MFS family permease
VRREPLRAHGRGVARASEAALLLSTIFTLGIGLGGLPAGYLMNRMSRKHLLVIGIAVYSLFTILTPLALNGLDMGICRTPSGSGEALQVDAS